MHISIGSHPNENYSLNAREAWPPEGDSATQSPVDLLYLNHWSEKNTQSESVAPSPMVGLGNLSALGPAPTVGCWGGGLISMWKYWRCISISL